MALTALEKTPIKNPSSQTTISGKRGKVFKIISHYVIRTVFRHQKGERGFRRFFHSLDLSFGSFLWIKPKKRTLKIGLQYQYIYETVNN
jgi:hypothetical protein